MHVDAGRLTQKGVNASTKGAHLGQLDGQASAFLA
jgi:hypothetical protein